MAKKKKAPTGKRHVLRTIADLNDLITPENAQNIASSLVEWIVMTATMKAVGNVVKQDQLVWVDDNIAGVSKMRVEMRNTRKKSRPA